MIIFSDSSSWSDLRRNIIQKFKQLAEQPCICWDEGKKKVSSEGTEMLDSLCTKRQPHFLSTSRNIGIKVVSTIIWVWYSQKRKKKIISSVWQRQFSVILYPNSQALCRRHNNTIWASEKPSEPFHWR